MATTHVFIVDTNTFKYHIDYMFAGTGAKDNYIDFNNTATTKLHHNTENNLVAMIADSQRVRKNDYVIFYLQQNFRDGIYEGKFYGIFKIKHDLSFLDNLVHKTSKVSLSKKYSDFKYPSKENILKLKWKNGFEHEIEMRTVLTQTQEKKLLMKFEHSDKKIIASFIRNFYLNNQYQLEE
ncbi:hypothetical protein J7L68_07330, partial [bacterium]|nr:hypothetical protein [bacterium]